MRSGELPARRTELIGRDGDVRVVIDQLLHGDGRLVSLTGGAGVGKTSLAVEVARAVADQFPDGVNVVDLAILPPDAPPEDVGRGLVRALGIADERRGPLDASIQHLQARTSLLVLDNCEHVAGAVARVADRLLDACPYVRLLATSRARLRVDGEAVHPVVALAVPAPGTPSASLEAADAVRLFVRRARAADPAFQLGDDNAEPVASICRRLDGIPLAIELAAAHVAALAPADIAARLGLEDGLLGRPGAATVGRQETLQAAIAWSDGLLSIAQRALFHRLSVFVAPWTLQAAEAVTVLAGDAAGATSLAADLAALVEQSLVVRDADAAGTRYRLHQPIAEYAAARLADSGGRDVAATAHATYLLGVVGTRLQPVPFAVPDDLDRMEAVIDDALAALRWASASGRVDLAMGLLTALIEWWRVRGHLRDALEHLDPFLALASGMEHPAVAFLLGARADTRRLLGMLDEAEADANQLSTLAERFGDELLARGAIALLGDIAAARGDVERALARYDEAASRYPLPGAGPVPGFWFANRGMIGLRGGEPRTAAALDDLRRAHAYLGEGIRTWYRGRVLASLGTAERRIGELDDAHGHLVAAFAELAEYGARVDAIEALEELGSVALAQGDAAQAAALLGCASALRDALAQPAGEAEAGRRAATVDAARARLGDAAFEHAWAIGRGRSLEEATALVVGEVPLVAPSSGSGGGRVAPRSSGYGIELTAREREVVALIADGLTNPQIADRLFISVGTARTHVERILGKLGLTSRVQVARWYADRDADLPDRTGPVHPADREPGAPPKSVT